MYFEGFQAIHCNGERGHPPRLSSAVVNTRTGPLLMNLPASAKLFEGTARLGSVPPESTRLAGKGADTGMAPARTSPAVMQQGEKCAQLLHKSTGGKLRQVDSLDVKGIEKSLHDSIQFTRFTDESMAACAHVASA